MANFTRTIYSGIPADKPAMRTAIVNAFTAAGFTLSTVTLSGVIYYYQNDIVIPSSSRTSCIALKFDDTLALSSSSWFQYQTGESFNTGTGAVTGGIGYENTDTWSVASTTNSETVTANQFAPDVTDSERFRLITFTARNGTRSLNLGLFMPYLVPPADYNSNNHNLSVGINQATDLATINGNVTTVNPFAGATTNSAGTITTSNVNPVREFNGQSPTYMHEIKIIYDGNGAGSQQIPIGHLGENIRFGSGVNTTFLLPDQAGQWICISDDDATGAIFLKIA